MFKMRNLDLQIFVCRACFKRMWCIFQILIIIFLQSSYCIEVPDPEIEILSISSHDYEIASTDFENYNGLILQHDTDTTTQDYNETYYDENRGKALRLSRVGPSSLEDGPGEESAYLYPNDSSTQFNPDIIEWSARPTTTDKIVAAFRVCVSSTSANTVAEVYFNEDGKVYLTDTSVAQNQELFSYSNDTWYDFRMYINWEESPPEVVLMAAESGNALKQIGTMSAKSKLAFFKYIYIYNYQANAVAWVDDIRMWDAKDYTLTIKTNATHLQNSSVDSSTYINYNINTTDELTCDSSTFSFNATDVQKVSFDTINCFKAMTCHTISHKKNNTVYKTETYQSSSVTSPQYNVRASIPYFTTVSTGYNTTDKDDTYGLSQISVRMSIDDREGYMYYSNDTEIVCDSSGVEYTEVLDLDRETTIHAAGCRDHTLQSRSNISDTYYVKNLFPHIILKSTGFYIDEAVVEITCSTPSGLIIYTTGDGSHDSPTCDWDFANTYWPSSGNLSCNDGGGKVALSTDNALSAIVCRTGNIASDVTGMTIVILDSGQFAAVLFGSIVVVTISSCLVQGCCSAVFSSAISTTDEWNEDSLKKKRQEEKVKQKHQDKLENRDRARQLKSKRRSSAEVQNPQHPHTPLSERSYESDHLSEEGKSPASETRNNLSNLKQFRFSLKRK